MKQEQTELSIFSRLKMIKNAYKNIVILYSNVM